MPDLCAQQFQSCRIAALFNITNRFRLRISNGCSCPMLEIDRIHIFNQIQHLGRWKIIAQPTSELSRYVKFPVAICPRSAKSGCNGARRQTSCKFLFPRSRRTKLNLLLQNGAAAAINIMPFIHQQHFPMRRFTRQLITGKNPRRSCPNNNYIVFTH
ncbi:hypothetical protein D3C76_1366790 [compost metagenome]